MPNTWRWLWQGGRTYPNFSISDPLCCPSRMTIMTGRYAHNTGVIDNLSSKISFHPDMRSTVQCYLQDAGYQTAFFGKYLNGWDFHRRPPCADRYAITPGERHYGLRFRTNDGVVQPGGWDDTYVTGQALDFLKTKAGDGPWFMTVSLMAPHSPYTPLPAVADAPVPPPTISPSVGQSDLSGMYKVVRRHAKVQTFDTRVWDGEIRMLRTVDSEVGQLREALDAKGDLDNTIVIYVSDNGLLLGEHRLEGKRLPYLEATDVPFAVSAPGAVPGGSVDRRLTSNVDIAADHPRRGRPRGRPALPARRLLAARRVVEAEAPVRGVLQRAPGPALGAAVAVDPRRRLPVHRVAVPDVPRAPGLARVLRPAHRPLRAPQPPARQRRRPTTRASSDCTTSSSRPRSAPAIRAVP